MPGAGNQPRESHTVRVPSSSESTTTRPREARETPSSGGSSEAAGAGSDTEAAAAPAEPETSTETEPEPPQDEADQVEISDEAREEPEAEEPEDQRTEFERNAENLETYFDVFDNPGGGDTDGTVSDDDIREIAEGDYDQDAARERLLDSGVAEDEVDEVLEGIEGTATYFTENEDERNQVDGADDGGDVDGDIGRGDLDQTLSEVRDERQGEVEDGQAVDILEENFEVFDNPGGGDTDGEISDGDLQDIAEGNYDRDAARERLRDQGVAEADLNDRLAEIESTAMHLLDSGEEGVYGELDIANDDSADFDGDIRRGDLDRYRLDNREEIDPEANPFEPSAEEVDAAQEPYQRFQDPEALTEALEERPLSEFDEGELLALAQISGENPEAQQQIQEAVLASVEGAESLEDLPAGTGFQHLLVNGVTGVEEGERSQEVQAANQHLEELVNQEVDARLDSLLEDRRGDSEADTALERFGVDLEGLVFENPALAQQIAARADTALQESGDRITDVRQADDSFLSQATRVVTDGLRAGAGFLGDRLRDLGNIAGEVLTAPLRVAGEVADFGLTAAGQVAGAGLDLVGADGLADDVRDASAEAGDLANGATDFVAEQQQNFLNGFAEGAAGTVEGVTQLVTDPVGTVQGIGALIDDPSLLLDGYGEILEEHGVAGLVGNLGFDVLTTVATGGGSAAASVSSRLARAASFLDDFGRAGSLGGRVTTAAARGLGHLDQFANGASNALGNLTDNVAGRLGRNLDLPEGYLDNVGSLDDALHNARLLDEQAAALGRSNPDSLLEGIDGGQVVAGNRQEAIQFLAQQNPGVDPSRIARWVNGDAAPGAEVAIIQAPAGTRFARGFDDAHAVRENLAGRESLNGAFPGTLDGRAYFPGPNGNYLNLADDVLDATRNQLRADNAVPILNPNDRFVIRALEEDGFVLASRVAGQRGADGFGAYAVGGGRQYRVVEGSLTDLEEFVPPTAGHPVLAGELAAADTVAEALEAAGIERVDEETRAYLEALALNLVAAG